MEETDKHKRFGCAAALSVFFSLCAVISLLALLLTGPYAISIWIPGAKITDGVIVEYEYVPIQRRGPDGDLYDDSEPHAVVRFQTEDGEERTFTNQKKAKTISEKGANATVCYNANKAMIAGDYWTAMRYVRKYTLRLVLSSTGLILLIVWIVMTGKQRNKEEKAAEQQSAPE